MGIMRALKSRGFTVKWFDKRKSVADLDFHAMVGLILNQQKTGFFSQFWNSRHWIAVPQIEGRFYNCNSSLSSPVLFEDTTALVEFIEQTIGGENNGSQL